MLSWRASLLNKIIVWLQPICTFTLRAFCNYFEKLRLAFSAASNIKNLFSSLDNTTYILYYLNMTGKEITKTLKKNGWTIDRIKGSHHIFIKGDKTIPVPVHGSKDLPIGTVKNIFRLAGIKE